MIEELETRLVPTIVFDSTTGLLTVIGDEAGPTDDEIGISLTESSFVEVVINSRRHSSDPASADFNPGLDGATESSVQFIDLQGLEGNDRLQLFEVFIAANGQITLDGGAGDDQLLGSSIFESLLGGAGDDTVTGAGGLNTVEGGSGNDVLIVLSPFETNSLSDSAGIETLDLSAIATVRVHLDLTLEDGEFQQFFPCPSGFTCGVALFDTIENIIGGALGDSIIGNAADNILVGGTGDDSILGGDGEDSLSGNSGDDTLDGGLGVDRVIESGDLDFVLNDSSLEGRGLDVLRSIESASLAGGAGPNRISASSFSGTTTLSGELGNDSLIGGIGKDHLIGGPGNDQFDGRAGSDTVDFTGAPAAITLDLSRRRVTGDGFDFLLAIENALGSRFDDLLIGDKLANLLDGGAGNDTLRAGSGSDTAIGGLGNDRLSGDGGSDSLDAGAGDDFVFGGASGDTLIGGPGADQLSGGGGFDRLIVDEADTIIKPGPGGGEIIAR